LLADDEAKRDEIVAKLKSVNIPTMVYYPAPLHMLEVFQDVNNYSEAFHNALSYCQRTFSLPMHPYLTEAEQQHVINCVTSQI